MSGGGGKMGGGGKLGSIIGGPIGGIIGSVASSVVSSALAPDAPDAPAPAAPVAAVPEPETAPTQATVQDADIEAAAREEVKRKKSAVTKTTLTGARGLAEEETLAKKTLLGS